MISPKLHKYRIGFWLGILGFLVALAAAFALTPKTPATEVLKLDIQAGEPVADAMARSTMTADFLVAMDMQGLPLPPLASWSATGPYQIELQTGGEHTITIPWTPSDGTIWMNAGVIDEIDLRFDHFETSSTGTANNDAPDTEVDIEAIIDIYSSLQAAAPRSAKIASCYHNLLEV